jgi:hypothetical protein
VYLSIEIDEQQIRRFQEPFVIPGWGNPEAVWRHQRADVPLGPSDKPPLVEALAD